MIDKRKQGVGAVCTYCNELGKEYFVYSEVKKEKSRESNVVEKKGIFFLQCNTAQNCLLRIRKGRWICSNMELIMGSSMIKRFKMLHK